MAVLLLASLILLVTVGTKTAARIAMIAVFHDKKHPFLLDFFIILLFWTVEKEKRDEKSSLLIMLIYLILAINFGNFSFGIYSVVPVIIFMFDFYNTISSIIGNFDVFSFTVSINNRSSFNFCSIFTSSWCNFNCAILSCACII